MNKKNKKKIYLAGHKGMVGSAMYKLLSSSSKSKNIEIITRTKKQLNLLDQKKVEKFFLSEKPDEVIISAAKVGGINANNKYPVNFLYENIMIESNLINQSFHTGIKKLIFLGSSCIYPKKAKQPIKEEYLLTGPLEETNEPYALAKIVGIKLCQSFNRQYGTDYRSLMPCNLYGPGDNYNLKESHVIPALIRKFYLAKKNKKKYVSIWGSGKPKREFLHVLDLASASLEIMSLSKKKYLELTNSGSHINIGSGKEISILELAKIISKIVNFKGEIKFDKSMPDGTMRKVLDITKIKNLDWKPNFSLESGIEHTYVDFLKTKKIRT